MLVGMCGHRAEVFEAELFGYVGGAFTGARREVGAGLIVSVTPADARQRCRG